MGYSMKIGKILAILYSAAAAITANTTTVIIIINVIPIT